MDSFGCGLGFSIFRNDTERYPGSSVRRRDRNILEEELPERVSFDQVAEKTLPVGSTMRGQYSPVHEFRAQKFSELRRGVVSDCVPIFLTQSLGGHEAKHLM